MQVVVAGLGSVRNHIILGHLIIKNLLSVKT